MNLKQLKLLLLIKKFVKFLILWIIIYVNKEFLKNNSYHIIYNDKHIVINEKVKFINKTDLVKLLNIPLEKIKSISYFYDKNNIILDIQYRQSYIKINKRILDTDLVEISGNISDADNIKIHIHHSIDEEMLQTYNKICKKIQQYLPDVRVDIFLINERRINIHINNRLLIKLPEEISLSKLELYFQNYYSLKHVIVDLRFQKKILLMENNDKIIEKIN